VPLTTVTSAFAPAICSNGKREEPDCAATLKVEQLGKNRRTGSLLLLPLAPFMSLGLASCVGLSAPHQHATAIAAGRAANVAFERTALAEASATSAYWPDRVATAQAQSGSQAVDHSTSGHTYADVRDHPDLYRGKMISWLCVIADFLGHEIEYLDNISISCNVYTREYPYHGGVGLGVVILSVVPTIETSQMHIGDDLQVFGWVVSSATGADARGRQITVPKIIPWALHDTGPDRHAGH
jgi:hypothetical protein